MPVEKVLVLDDWKLLFELLSTAMDENKELLIELDQAMGDGDLGLTMSAAFAAAKALASEWTEEDIGKLLLKAGMTMASVAPSTMGTLMATGFMRGGRPLKGAISADLQMLVSFFQSFTDGIMERGKAELGEKTILDVLQPATDSLKDASARGDSLSAALLLAKSTAEVAMEESDEMLAQHGRAAYYQEKSIGVRDPGTMVGVIIITAFADLARS